MNASIVDLRYRMKDVLRAIERGEIVTVLHRGKAKARLSPVESPDQAVAKTSEQPFFGLWHDRHDMANPVDVVRALRGPRKTVAAATAPKKPVSKRVR